MKNLGFALILFVCLSSFASSYSQEDQPASSFDEKLKAGDQAVSAEDFDRGVSLYKESKDIAMKDKNEWEIAESARKIAVAYAGAGQYTDAIENFKESVNHTNDLKNEKILRTCILSKFGLAKMYNLTDNQELAWINCEEAITLSSDNLPASDPVISRLTALKSELILKKAEIQIEPAPPKEEEEEEHSNTTLVAEINITAPAVIPAAPSGFQKLQSEKGLLVPSKTQTGNVHETKLSGAASARKELAMRLMQYGTMGLFLRKDIGGPWIVQNPLNGGAAQYYGVQRGDILTAINGQDISNLNITTIYFMLTGKRGEIKHLEIVRPGHKLEIQIPLWSVYDMHDRNTEYIEYYWFLLYNNLITPEQYQRLAKPYEPYIQ